MNRKLIPYPVIIAAKHGDSDAMNEILTHNAGRIDSFSRRLQLDEYSNLRSVVDTEIRDRIIAKIIDRVIFDFDPYRLPDGETLEK